MLSGKPPHYSSDQNKMMNDIVNKPIEMKPYFSENAKSLLEALLNVDPYERIGIWKQGF
jgi:hypothetical protein